MTPVERVSVVIAEHGAPLEAGLAGVEATGPGVLLLTQPADESSASFVARVRERLAKLMGRGTKVEAGWVLASPDGDRERVASRALLARMLGSAIVRGGGGKLVFAGTKASSAARRAALAIGDALAEQFRATPLAVQVTA